MTPDFIEVYEPLLDPQFCAEVRRRFDHSAHRPGEVGGGIIPQLKNSRDLMITGDPGWEDVCTRLNQAMMTSLLRYIRTYPYAVLAPLLLQFANPETGTITQLTPDHIASMEDEALMGVTAQILRPGSINLQRYAADEGGYPYWHCELYPSDSRAETLHRTLLWTVYLNDDFKDGETEFLYQQRKITPRIGSLLIAPTAFTHTHRGNRPSGGDKYIATSWVLFQRGEGLFRA